MLFVKERNRFVESVDGVCVCRYENSGRRSLVLIMFIGGVTFAEISALRFLNAQVKSEYCVLDS